MKEQAWQYLHGAPHDRLRALYYSLSLSHISLSTAWRNDFGIIKEELQPQFDPLSSTESQAVFSAVSADFKVELRCCLQPALVFSISVTPLKKGGCRFEWVRLRFGSVKLGPQGRQTRVFKQGYQSWSETRSFDSREREQRALLSWLDVLQANARNRATGKRGQFTSEMFTLFGNLPQRLYWLVGQQAPFAQYLSFRSRFDPRAADQSRFALEITWDLGGQQLPAGKAQQLDTVKCLAGGEPYPLLDEYLGDFQPQTLPLRRLPAGWCSWYYYFTRVSAKVMQENLQTAAEHGVDWQFFLLDDGYQQAIGDWLLVNKKFPEGLAPLASQVNSQGMRPGIWTAPFIVMKNSQLAEAHPEWLLRQPFSKKPVLAGWNPNWGGNFYALDVTHPGVQNYLRTVFRRLTHEFGFRFLKLDFTYAASLAGSPYDPSYTSAGRLRLGYQLIRQAAGEEVFVLGCGSPIPPAIGLVDAMRIGPDVAPYWEDWLRAELTRDSNALSTKNAIRSILNRAAMHRRLWINDPDCLMLREKKTRLSRDERFCLINAAIITGGMGIFSDRLEALPEECWQQIAQIGALSLACDGGQVDVVDFMENPMPELVYNTAGYLAVFNFGEFPQEKLLSLPGRLLKILPPGTELQEVWSGERRQVGESGLDLGVFPRHCSRLYRIIDS